MVTDRQTDTQTNPRCACAPRVKRRIYTTTYFVQIIKQATITTGYIKTFPSSTPLFIADPEPDKGGDKGKYYHKKPYPKPLPIWLWPLVAGQEARDGLDGEKGQKGWQGLPGETGPQGPRGIEEGEMGDEGDVGATGEMVNNVLISQAQ